MFKSAMLVAASLMAVNLAAQTPLTMSVDTAGDQFNEIGGVYDGSAIYKADARGVFMTQACFDLHSQRNSTSSANF